MFSKWIVLFFIVFSINRAQGNPMPDVSLDDFHVCTVASYTTQNLEKLLLSCTQHHIDLEVLGMGMLNYTHGDKLRYMAQYLETLDDHEIVMFVDAFDVLIVADKALILKKFMKMNTPFLMSAEKNCYPAHLISRYPSNSHPFQYINSGSYIGYVKNLKEWLGDLELNAEIRCDQGLISEHYLNGNVFFDLDYGCELFLPLYLVRKSEIGIDFRNKTVRCLTRQSEPCVIHANGHSFRFWNIIYHKLTSR